jgi:hypothetical protein
MSAAAVRPRCDIACRAPVSPAPAVNSRNRSSFFPDPARPPLMPPKQANAPQSSRAARALKPAAPEPTTTELRARHTPPAWLSPIADDHARRLGKRVTTPRHSAQHRAASSDRRAPTPSVDMRAAPLDANTREESARPTGTYAVTRKPMPSALTRSRSRPLISGSPTRPSTRGSYDRRAYTAATSAGAGHDRAVGWYASSQRIPPSVARLRTSREPEPSAD